MYTRPNSHDVHVARQRLYVLSHSRPTPACAPLSRTVQALTLDTSTRPRFCASLLSRSVRALDLAFIQVHRATSAPSAFMRMESSRPSSVSTVPQTRPPSLASLGASIGSHATTIRNNMPVYDGDSEVLEQARHAPDAFARFTNMVAAIVGTPWAFGAAVGVVGLWLALGPVGQWSNTWQLVINTSTTIISFWMLFVVANTQNREAATMSLKIEQLMRLQHEVLMWQRTTLPENHPARLLPMPGPDDPAFV